MEEILTVCIFAVVILAVSLLAGRLPFIIKKDAERLHFLIAFSAGVMVGVLFIMLMPEALERTEDADYGSEVSCYMILIGFLLLFIVDFLVKRYLGFDEHDEDEHSHSITSMSAFTGLAIHSFFDGLALAAAFVAGDDVGIMVLIALCLHKAVVVFSLSSTMLMSENRKSTWRYLAAFSVISPLATVVSYLFLDSDSMDFAGPALCFSVGIFMFVTLCDMVPEAFHHKDKDPSQLLTFIAGLIVVILVAAVSSAMMGDVDI